MSKQETLGRSTIFYYGSIGFPLALIGYPVAIWLPAFYSTELGVSLSAVGTMLMLARFTDVVTDPLIGDLSDRFGTRFGRRKPWLFAGVPVMMLGIHMLFNPVTPVGTWYLLIWVSIMMLGSTMIGLPYGAWGAELSADYHQRTRVTAGRELFVLVGLLGAALIPAVVQFYGDSRSGPVLEAMGWVILVVLPLAVGLALWRVSEPRTTERHTLPLGRGLRLMWRNGPMKRVLLIIILVVSGEAFRNALSLFFMRDVIGIAKIGNLYFLYFGTGLAAVPIWLWLGKRIDKHRAFALCMVVVSLVSIATFFLGRGDVLPFTLLFAAKGFCFGGLQFLPLAMLADVVDVDAARSGSRRAGTFFGFESMGGKMARAVGTGLSLNIAALVGYDPSGVAGANGPTELTWLAFLYAIMPPLFFASALWLTWNYPLTSERHRRLRSLLERRAARRAARGAAPATSSSLRR
jgi:GPH family glycoside/pentoside/hexuronide:cation symporter